MPDFVEREKILALQTDLHFDNIEQLKHWKCRHIDPTDVELLPAADVRPVVRGHWTNHRTLFMDGEWYCSACGKEITIYMGPDRENRYAYCPNCGADMREEGVSHG